MTRRHRSAAVRLGALAAVAVSLAAPGASRADEPDHVFAEVDPLPFALGGYGVQLGYRPQALGGVRAALASFSLDVPDMAVQRGGNDDFHARVRPSAALYVLYYPSPSRSGWALGGALRYLRLRFRHDQVPGAHADVDRLSPEVIAGYKWHPFAAGFYLQPWVGLSVTVWERGEADVGAERYDAPALEPFATVNLGWELSL